MTDEVSIDSDVQALLDAGAELAKPTEIAAVPGYAHSWLVPAGASVHTDDLERFAPNPFRRRGVAEMLTVESLTDYVNRHADNASTVWWDETTGTVEAVLDDHAGWSDAEPYAGWGQHRAVLVLGTTPEWDFWMGKDGTLVSQQQFAEHIEEGSREVVEPDAATMLEIAQTLQVASSAQFRSATRLQSGTTSFLYDEEHTAAAGATGQLSLPTEFVIGMAPYIGEDPYRVTARLRYRLRTGELKIGYKLDRPERVLRDCMASVAARLGENLKDDVAIFAGRPRAS